MQKLIFTLFLLTTLLATGCAGLAEQATAFVPQLDQSAAPAQSESIVQEPAQTVQDSGLNQPVVLNQEDQLSPLTVDQIVQAQEQAFIDVYERVNPAVVHIGIGVGQGSGFIIDIEGYIVTNNHVVAGARDIVVTFSDGTQRDASIVGTDPDSDLALLKVDAAPGELTAVALGDSDQLKVGQMVVAIGSPFGQQNTLTTGIVSGLNRLFPSGGTMGSYNIPDVVQTDAAINPGNSGGPLLNLRGEVIGVNTAIESPVRASSGVGFAVPSNVVKIVVPQLLENGRVAYPWLGISGTQLNAELATAVGLDTDQRGVLIASVIAGGPAAQAGIRAGDPQTGAGGDIIVAIDGQTVRSFDDLLGYVIQKTRVGQTVELQVLRDGEMINLPLTLAERPSSS